MPITNPSNIAIGQVVRFKTLNPHDSIYHTGKIKSICDYNVARIFDDIDVYYQEVKREVPSLGDKQSLTYWLLDVSENSASSVTRVFALEVVDVSTLEVVAENTYTDIRVYDIDDAKAQDVVAAIKALGYICEIAPD